MSDAMSPAENRSARIRRMAAAMSLATGLDVAWQDVSSKLVCPEPCAGRAFCAVVQGCAEGKTRCERSVEEGGRQSAHLGEAYVARCHAGVVFVSAPLMERGEYFGCLECGPMLMWDWDEIALTEFLQRTADLPISKEALLVASRDIRRLDGRTVRAVGEMLYAIAANLSRDSADSQAERKQRSLQQAQLADVLLRAKNADEGVSPRGRSGAAYPLNMERELLGKVRLGDKPGARAILNELLGHILYKTAGNTDVMKARILELVIMVSRAAVEGGAPLEKLLGLNYNFIGELSALTQFEDICLWLVKVLDAFMDTVYETRNEKGTHLLGDALDTIRQSYMTPLSLERVAAAIHISPFYLSHLFKEELGVTFVDYLTRVRIEAARQLMLDTELSIADIAQRVGYEDPSYFSKVFKKTAGMTPNRYRRAQ